MKVLVWTSEAKLSNLLTDEQKNKIYMVSDKHDRSVYLQVITVDEDIYIDTIDDSTIATWLKINDDKKLPFPIEGIDKISLIWSAAAIDVRVLIS